MSSSSENVEFRGSSNDRLINLNTSPQQTGETPNARRVRPVNTKESGCAQFMKMLALTIVIGSLIVGTTGLLTYLGKLGITWQGVGTISQQIGLYMMLGGYGLTAILTILLVIRCCMNSARENGRTLRQPPVSNQPPVLNSNRTLENPIN